VLIYLDSAVVVYTVPVIERAGRGATHLNPGRGEPGKALDASRSRQGR